MLNRGYGGSGGSEGRGGTGGFGAGGGAIMASSAGELKILSVVA